MIYIGKFFAWISKKLNSLPEPLQDGMAISLFILAIAALAESVIWIASVADPVGWLLLGVFATMITVSINAYKSEYRYAVLLAIFKGVSLTIIALLGLIVFIGPLVMVFGNMPIGVSNWSPYSLAIIPLALSVLYHAFNVISELEKHFNIPKRC